MRLATPGNQESYVLRHLLNAVPPFCINEAFCWAGIVLCTSSKRNFTLPGNPDILSSTKDQHSYESFLHWHERIIVSDGRGGHAYWQEARRIVIQVISNNLLPLLLANANVGEDDLSSLLVYTIHLANRAVY
jgi:hypothetical protein